MSWRLCKSLNIPYHPKGYLITNFDISEFLKYQKRLDIFNMTCPDSPVKFKIVAEAYDCDGKLCPEMQAVVCNPVNAIFDNKMKPFFDTYDRIHQSL